MTASIADSRPVLLFGAGGQLGGDFVRCFEANGSPLVAASSKTHGGWRKLDICDRNALFDLVNEVKPAFVINASAYTAVDQAQIEPELAFMLNATVPQWMAEACNAHHASLIHFSTDYVFDGNQSNRGYTESDMPQPLNVYGQSKLQGEQAVLAMNAGHYVFRTSWLYSPGERNFVTTMLRLFQADKTVRVVDDQHGCPTNAQDLAHVIVAWLLRTPTKTIREQAGLYHLCSSGQCTWFEFANAIWQRADPHSKVQLEPIDTASFGAAAARPAVSVLDCERASKHLNLQLPPWLEALDAAMPAFNQAAISQ